MKRVLFFVFFIASVFVIKNLVFSIYSLWQKQDLVVDAQNELVLEVRKNAELKKKLKEVSSEQFIEEQARNKLFFTKPGETQVIMPDLATASAEKQDQEKQEPNWKQWLSLFF